MSWAAESANAAEESEAHDEGLGVMIAEQLALYRRRRHSSHRRKRFHDRLNITRKLTGGPDDLLGDPDERRHPVVNARQTVNEQQQGHTEARNTMIQSDH